MTDEQQMEQLSRVYTHGVAAMARCTCARPDPDYGIDLTLRRITQVGREFLPSGQDLDIQLKSTTKATLSPGEVVYDLDIRAYNIIRRATRNAPVMLVLIVFPPDPIDWLVHSEDRLEIRGSGYWLWLRSAPAVTNTSTVRVHIPRRNQFTPAALTGIMDAIRRQEDPT